jgi:hypothetical protein
MSTLAGTRERASASARGILPRGEKRRKSEKACNSQFVLGVVVRDAMDDGRDAMDDGLKK